MKPAPGARTQPSLLESPAVRGAILAALFVAGLYFRMSIFKGAHQEADESIYITLVQQLDAGHGYTLQGSQILNEGMIDREEYDHPLFFHPPGGIALDWVFYKSLGDWGFAYVQLFSYALFFGSMILLAMVMGLGSSTLGLTLVAALSAFDPIAAHVATRFWLDGPLLAFTTLAAALFVWSASRGSASGVAVAGLVLGYASWIKMTAFLIAPGVVLLMLALAWTREARAPESEIPPRSGPGKPAAKSSGKTLGKTLGKKAASSGAARPSPPDPSILPAPPPEPAILRRLLLLGCVWVAIAVIVQLPWEIWQWRVAGSPFPVWAGKPSQSLIDANRYVRYLTVVRSPWVYVTLTPRILWTWIPTLVLLALLWVKPRVRAMAAGLLLWAVAVLAFHVFVGYHGYSKVLRYVILVVPPSILLFAMLVTEAVRAVRSARTGASSRIALIVLLCVCAAAAALQIAAGVDASTSIKRDLLVPLWGKAY